MTNTVFAVIIGSVVLCAQTPEREDTKAGQPSQSAAGTVGASSAVATDRIQVAQRTSPPTPVVMSVENANGKDKNLARLTDRILVKVENLDELLKDKPASSVILYLDGRPLVNTKAQPIEPFAKSQIVLAFDLLPNYDQPEEAEAWRRILISARRANPDQVRLSVGLPDGVPIKSGAPLLLQSPKPLTQVAVYAGLGLLFVGVIVLAIRTPMIRSGGCFSLGLTQMTVWFCLIVLGWAFISLMTKSAAHLSNGVLILMGISRATGLSAVAINADRTRPAKTSKNWIRDILSDENGISFNRLQMFVWTVALGIYFVVSIFKDYVMPEFDTQLLVLMGISSGTYVGFKFPEPLAKTP